MAANFEMGQFVKAQKSSLIIGQMRPDRWKYKSKVKDYKLYCIGIGIGGGIVFGIGIGGYLRRIFVLAALVMNPEDNGQARKF